MGATSFDVVGWVVHLALLLHGLAVEIRRLLAQVFLFLADGRRALLAPVTAAERLSLSEWRNYFKNFARSWVLRLAVVAGISFMRLLI